MNNDNATIGKASLWTSIIGFGLPAILAVLFTIVYEDMDVRRTLFVLLLAFSVMQELIAFGCGVAARRTVSGKSGLIISSVILTLYLLVLCCKFIPE